MAALEMPPNRFQRFLKGMQTRNTLLRVTLLTSMSVLTAVIIQGWNPPFSYRTGFIPRRDIVAAMPFQKPDPVATELARDRAKSQVRCVYINDPEPLIQLKASLRNTLLELAADDQLTPLEQEVWNEFQPPREEGEPAADEEELAAQFRQFHAKVVGEKNLAKIEEAVASALAPFESQGLLDKLTQTPQQLNQEQIVVHPKGRLEIEKIVNIADVLIGDGNSILQRLEEKLGDTLLAARLFAWLRPRLKPTLTFDEAATQRAIRKAADSVEEVYAKFAVGQVLCPAGKPLGRDEMDLLRCEYAAAMYARAFGLQLFRFSAVVAVCLTLFSLSFFYLSRREPQLFDNLTRLTILLTSTGLTVGIVWWSSTDAWRAELVPILLFAQIAAIVHRQEFGLLFSTVVILLVVVELNLPSGEILTLLVVCTVAILQLGTIRTRSKLIVVGLVSGFAAVFLTVVGALIDGQPFTWTIVREGLRNGLCALAAGFIMTGVLPFVEKYFGVLTDLSLLELGDVAHPLLQELVRRAPSTYNHSITVGSIAEAAADAIGARGLLVRVGAYYHDIGKMLKPGYFIENQGRDPNRHEQLVPAMSTLVIIAHIKDGANLARQHRLPQPILDFILQHHGTTLVGYFFDRASRQSQEDPNGRPVEESAFRYPGPKPQSKEAGILMLADAVESASRTLVDPTPSRIENLVHQIVEQRLEDGQFDDSGMNFRELRTVEKSLIKSLIAIYHGRVKYPEPRLV